MDIARARKQVRKVLARLTLMRPWLGLPASKLGYVYVQGDKENIAWTDGKNIYVTDRFFDFKIEEQEYVIAHELLHVVLEHVDRGKNLHPVVSNIAADAIVNYALDKSGMQRPEIVAVKTWNRYNDYVIEFGHREIAKVDALEFKVVYDAIVKDKQIRQVMRPGQGGCGGGCKKQGQKNGSTGRGQGQEQAPDLGPAKAGREFRKSQGRTIKKPSSDIEKAADRKQVARQLRDAMRQGAKMAGNMPGEVKEWLEDMDKAEIDWRSVLRKWATAQRRKRQSWSWPSYAVPRWKGKVKDRGQPVVFVLGDTSGSISNEQFEQFLAEVRAMVRAADAKVIWAVFDTRIAETGRIERKSDRIRMARTFGGTDPTMAVRNARPMLMREIRKARARIAVLFSDMWFDNAAGLTEELNGMGFGNKIAVATRDAKQETVQELERLGWMVLNLETA
ncbi:MAG: hypothetical protein DRQ10_04225 [Candidatus Hydrothermota bacterium]|nr:MAG: hypothetical protein DRQ10_04225 [Candidatus Hydrothermae bacterium]